MAPVLAQDYISFEIDVDRMTNGKEVASTLTGGRSTGYPWFAIVNGDGEVIGTSDGPNGNIGCPVTEEEAAVLFEVLANTRIRITDEQLAVVKAEHAEFARPILERMQGR